MMRNMLLNIWLNQYVKKEHSEYLKGYFKGIDKAALVNLTLSLYDERNKAYLPNQVNIEL